MNTVAIPRTNRLPRLDEIATGDSTLTLRGLRAEPDDAPAILIVPAMGTASWFYVPLARALNAAGLTALTVDWRGHGESTPKVSRASVFGYREIVDDDLTAVVASAGRLFPSAPLVILGHSLGGQLSLLHLARHRPDVRAVVLVASGSAYHGGFGGLIGLRNLVCAQAFALSARVLGYWPGHRVGFGGRESRGVMRDWAHQVRTGRYEPAGDPFDYETALGEVRVPILAVDVEGDTLAPPRTVSHLLGKLPGARVTRWSYTRSAAGGKPLDHFRWVRYQQGLVPEMTAWIKDQARLEAV
jgi:predicted alpha/beta hydrolase